MTVNLAGIVKINSSRHLNLTSGTVRPNSPVTGMLFYNTSTGKFEVYNGTAWKEAAVSAAVEIPSLWTWGRNNSGQLGDGTITNSSSPVSVVGGITDWVQVSGGASPHGAALRANGTVWCWGSNNTFQLGDGTNTNSSSPVSVVGGITDWVWISAGGNHNAAIRANGTGWAWGYNNIGQLGDNTQSQRSSPVSIVGGFTDWVEIVPGSTHTAAIRANGTAWCWGNGSVGQLGNNNTLAFFSPVSVIGGFTDWVQIQPGAIHTIGLRANGQAWSWGGQAAKGCLGTGNTTGSFRSPVSVAGGISDWVQISSGYYHTAAIRANGTAWCWGYNNRGQLGDATITIRNSPVAVVGGFTDWVQISANSLHTAAIRANGQAWAWGSNTYGQLGDSTNVSKRSPVSVAGGFTDWVKISSGYNFTTGLRAQPRQNRTRIGIADGK